MSPETRHIVNQLNGIIELQYEYKTMTDKDERINLLLTIVQAQANLIGQMTNSRNCLMRKCDEMEEEKRQLQVVQDAMTMRMEEKDQKIESMEMANQLEEIGNPNLTIEELKRQSKILEWKNEEKTQKLEDSRQLSSQLFSAVERKDEEIGRLKAFGVFPTTQKEVQKEETPQFVPSFQELLDRLEQMKNSAKNRHRKAEYLSSSESEESFHFVKNDGISLLTSEEEEEEDYVEIEHHLDIFVGLNVSNEKSEDEDYDAISSAEEFEKIGQSNSQMSEEEEDEHNGMENVWIQRPEVTNETSEEEDEYY